jgi:DNA processing protein
VTDALSTRSPRSIEDVAARAGLSVADVQGQLGALQVMGGVVESERGWTAKKL